METRAWSPWPLLIHSFPLKIILCIFYAVINHSHLYNHLKEKKDMRFRGQSTQKEGTRVKRKVKFYWVIFSDWRKLTSSTDPTLMGK